MKVRAVFLFCGYMWLKKRINWKELIKLEPR